MYSIRTKITAVTISAIIITMITATVLGVFAIRNIGIHSSEQMLLLLCETGGKNLNSCLEDVEQDVQAISAYVEADLKGLEDQKLQAHLDRVSTFFRKVLYKTNGIMTYYYRIDPEISTNVEGFWFVRSESGNGYEEHEVTDITKYDTDDTTRLVWFTVPKATGKHVWLHPYITDNLDARVISYNMPIYLDGRFVGVIGIELDYSFMAELVNNITLYENGYAFIDDEKGNIIYHPRLDVTATKIPTEIPVGVTGDSRIYKYSYEGVDKMAVSTSLCNGDRLNVSVPLREINSGWQRWVTMIISAFSLLLIAFITFIMRYAKCITKPLLDLTKVAEQIGEGNYDGKLDYKGNDEIGILTRTFSRVTAKLKKQITDLNDLAYADALTDLHNKGAFEIYVDKLQKQIEAYDRKIEFAVCVFDCNGLKDINDKNGHDKGDIYLKETAAIICEVFDHSPIFRIGGDEFVAVLMDRDYMNREELLRVFDEKCEQKRREKTYAWEQVDVARGIAVYNPDKDENVNNVVRRADKTMYENKWRTKHRI